MALIGLSHDARVQSVAALAGGFSNVLVVGASCELATTRAEETALGLLVD